MQIFLRSRWDNCSWGAWQHEKSEGSNDWRIASRGTHYTLLDHRAVWRTQPLQLWQMRTDVPRWPTRMQMQWVAIHFKWEEIAVLTVTHANISHETNYRSQQRRFNLVTDINEAKDPKNTGIRFYHFHLALQQFVECATYTASGHVFSATWSWSW